VGVPARRVLRAVRRWTGGRRARERGSASAAM